MNDKDLEKLTLGIAPDGSNVKIFRPHPSGDGRTVLEKSVTSEFIHCMVHYLNLKGDDGKKPVIIFLNRKPAFEITIKPYEPPVEVAPSLILNPTGKPSTE